MSPAETRAEVLEWCRAHRQTVVDADKHHYGFEGEIAKWDAVIAALATEPPQLGPEGLCTACSTEYCDAHKPQLATDSETEAEYHRGWADGFEHATAKAQPASAGPEVEAKRGAAELAEALRVRAAFLSGASWEVPATAAMMREAADMLTIVAQASMKGAGE